MNSSYPFCSHISYLPLHNKLLPKCTSWKQHTFIISQLLWARIQARLYCVHSPQGFSWAEIEVSSGLWFKWDFKKKNKKQKTCVYVHGTAFQHLVLCRQLNLGSQMLTAVGCRPASGPSHIGQPIVAASSPWSPRTATISTSSLTVMRKETAPFIFWIWWTSGICWNCSARRK